MLQSPEESLVWEALESDIWEWLWGFLCRDIPGFHGSHIAPEEQAPPGKSQLPSGCGNTVPYNLPLESYSLHPTSFFCPFKWFVQCFVLFCLDFLPFLICFLPSCILTPAEETEAYTDSGGFRDQL